MRPDSDFKDEPRKKPEPHKSKVFEDLRPTPNDAVNYGKGGSPNLPNGFGNNPGQAAAGVQVQGQGGGDFTTRYGWYIDAVRRKINSNWDQFTIDAATRSARRAKTTMTFTIYRDGSSETSAWSNPAITSPWTIPRNARFWLRLPCPLYPTIIPART